MMSRNYSRSVVIIMVMMTIACTSGRENSTETVADIPVCGTVQFSDGCSSELDKDISYGLALVHHMTYDEAAQVFTEVMEADPKCFWGPWGKALTYIHPLWNDSPAEAQMKDGSELSRLALTLAKNEKEVAYGRALHAYYENGQQKTEKERLKNYHDAWMTAYNSNPKDLEAKAFYALSLIATADPKDKTFANQLKAGALSEELLKEIEDHPGAFHYIIHAYDVPGLSDRALAVANKYGTIAPEIPHALHMPSHIFTRLGLWEKSVEWNKRSASTAYAKPTQGAVSMHYFHALDYLVYAYLQLGEDNKARMILEDIKKLKEPFQTHNATAYALAAVEGRVYLERQDWKRAAAVTLPYKSSFQWDKFPEYEALVHFTTGLGAARSGAKDEARKALRRLDELQSSIKNPYWSDQITIQKNIINAWIAFGRESKKEAIDLMKAAAEQEWATQKHPITPGELLPARELFADMLLEMDRSNEALEQYEMTLQRSPQRLNSLYGAARSAQLSGDELKARRYYEQLQALTAAADNTLARRQESLEYLKKL